MLKVEVVRLGKTVDKRAYCASRIVNLAHAQSRPPSSACLTRVGGTSRPRPVTVSSRLVSLAAPASVGARRRGGVDARHGARARGERR